MIRRFCLYSVFKNLRFFEHFFILFLLAPASVGGAGLSFFHIGLLTGYQKLLTALLEIPTGFFADRHGRLRSLVLTFGCYTVAFPLYAVSSGVSGGRQLTVLVLAQTLFGVGEAFRTGTHKAVQLDWIDRSNPPGGATRVIGITRFWSKLASGVSALAGGVLLWATGTFTWLFVLATGPAVAGIVLMRSYPRWLEGEYSRRDAGSDDVSAGGTRDGAPQLSLRPRLAALWAAPGIGILVVTSVFFESLLKLAQQYIQPFLGFGLEAREVAVIGGVGGVLIGFYYLVEGVFGGAASWAAARVERASGRWILDAIHAAAAVMAGAAAFSLWGDWFVAGVVAFLALIALQNLRRPIYLSRLNELMDKPQRAATLSVESQARSFAFAVIAPATGWAADRYGLAGALVVIAVLLGATAVLGLRGRRTHA